MNPKTGALRRNREERTQSGEATRRWRQRLEGLGCQPGMNARSPGSWKRQVEPLGEARPCSHSDFSPRSQVWTSGFRNHERINSGGSELPDLWCFVVVTPGHSHTPTAECSEASGTWLAWPPSPGAPWRQGLGGRRAGTVVLSPASRSHCPGHPGQSPARLDCVFTGGGL